MIYQYEMACKEAGMSEEAIKELRKMFDTDYKHVKRQKEQRMKTGYAFTAIDRIQDIDGEIGTVDIADDFDLEEDFIHRCDLGRLDEILQELSDEDRAFILDAFDQEVKTVKALAEKYEMSFYAARYRRDKLLAWLREKFFEEI